MVSGTSAQVPAAASQRRTVKFLAKRTMSAPPQPGPPSFSASSAKMSLSLATWKPQSTSRSDRAHSIGCTPSIATSRSPAARPLVASSPACETRMSAKCGSLGQAACEASPSPSMKHTLRRRALPISWIELEAPVCQSCSSRMPRPHALQNCHAVSAVRIPSIAPSALGRSSARVFLPPK